MEYKRVLITGAARRIGREIALAFARDGWRVFVHCRRSVDDAARLAGEIEAAGGAAFVVQSPLDGADDAATTLQQCIDLDGVPDCIVNNAALFEYDSGGAIDPGVFQRSMHTNLLGPIGLALALHRGLPAGRQGCVINLLDQKVFNLNPDYLSYTLAKCALQGATEMLAVALAPAVRVVGIAPGISLPSGDQTADEFARAHRVTPLGASSTADDIARAALFLAGSPAITGTTLVVDGGQHLVPLSRDVMFLAR
ncbi:MAG: SDR family oxidoreductase [Burkholderiaceae bacterium]